MKILKITLIYAVLFFIITAPAFAVPVITYTSIAPNPTVGCTDIQVDASVFNNSGAATLFETDFVITIPADYYFISATPAAVYNAVAHTVTWDLGNIAPLATENVELHIQANCTAASGQTLSAMVYYRDFIGEPDPKHSTGPQNSGAITINAPPVTITLGEFTTGDQVIWEESDSVVEYKITVSNAGPGASPGENINFTYEAGISLVSIKNDSAIGANVAYTLVGNVASWTTDPIASGGQEVFYVRVDTTGCANLNATAEIAGGCADDGGAPSCSSSDSSSALVRCPLSFTITETMPEGGGTYVSSCQDFTLDVDITNNDENQLDSVNAVVTIPDDYYYVSSVPASTYNVGAHTISYNIGNMAGFATQNLSMVLRPSCDAHSNQQVLVSVTYEAPVQTQTLPRSTHIDVRTPVINMVLEDDGNPGSTTIDASRGDVVVFRMNVINTGAGSLLDGATLEFTAGTGFTNVEFLDELDALLAPQPTWDGAKWTWNSGAVNAETVKIFKVRMTVNDCENLTNGGDFSWGCADDGGAPACSKTNGVNASIKIILKTPVLALTVPAIAVDWCAGDSVNIPVVNNGTGPARNVQVDITGFDLTNLDIVTTVASDFTFTNNGGVAEFRLITGDDSDNDTASDDINAGNTYDIDFTISVKAGGAGCPASGGGLLYEPLYQDDCDVDYTAGTDVGSYSVSTRPEVTIDKTGPTFVDTNDTITWSFIVSNTHTAAITVEVIDDYPDAGDTPNGWGDFVVTNADGGTDNGDTVTFTVANGNAIAIPAGGSVTKNIVLNTPTETCAGGQTYTNTASMTFSQNDCNGCAVPGNGTSDSDAVIVNNDQETVLNSHDREVLDYINYNSNSRQVVAGTGEACSFTENGSGTVLIKGGVVLSATMNFNTGANVPATWDDTDGAGNNITFTENLSNNLEIPAAVTGGDSLAVRMGLSVTYNGADITGVVSVTDNGGSFTIDFGTVDEATYGRPNDGHKLVVIYTLYAPDASVGSFNSNHTLTIPNVGAGCLSATPEDFDQGVIVNISSSSADIAVSKRTAPTQFMDKCETATFRLTISPDQAWTIYDSRVELDLAGRYEWDNTSTVTFNGFTDENDAPIAAFNPAEVGNVLRWDFADLNTCGYIEVELTKRCTVADTTLAATVDTNTNCDNVADGTSYGTNSSGGSWTAALLRGGDMEVVLTPETYYVKTGYPVMRFYVINSGNGNLYNMEVPLVLGAELDYLNNTPTLPVGTTLTTTVIDNQNVNFAFDILKPGEQLYVEFEMRAMGCNTIDVDIINAYWGCYGQTTQCDSGLLLNDTANVLLADTDIIVTDHSAVPDFIDLCGAPSVFTVRIENSGISEVYEAIAREDFPAGLSLFGTPQYRIDEDGDDVWDAPLANFPRPGGYTSYVPGTGVVEWNFMDPNDDGNQVLDSLITTTDGHEADGDGLRHFVLKPGGKIEIIFQANIANCTDADAYYTSDRQARAEVDFDRPCNHANAGAPLTTAGLNVVVELPTEANIDILKQGRNPSGAPWNGAWVASEVRAEAGQTVDWKIKLTSDGDGAGAEVYLEDVLPDNSTYVGWSNVGAESSAGISMNYLSGDGTAGNPLRWVVNNTNYVDNPGTPADETTYLDKDDFVTIQIQTTVNTCNTLKTNISTVEWGCCSPGAPGTAHGMNQAAVDLMTQPDGEPTVTISELGGANFEGCNGAFRVTLNNPNTDFVFYGFDLSLPVPADYDYDNSAANLGTTFAYAGNAARAGIILTQIEEEPTLNGGVLYWQGVSDAFGAIADAKAVILPGETITIDINFMTDGVAVCDPGSANDGTNPYDVGALANFDSTFTANFDDSCGNPAVNDTDLVSVNPEQADIDVTILNPVPDLGMPGDTIAWTIRLRNRGELAADNTEMTITFGDGWENISRTGGAPAEDSLALNVATWNRGTITIPATTNLTWIFDADIKAASGDLSVTVDVDGYCVNLNSADICQYTDDQSVRVLAGAEVRKTIINVNAPAVITNPDTATATHCYGAKIW